MTEAFEPKVAVPCTTSCESALQHLYVDLCNLIVESRIPILNEKGYRDGLHCPPSLGLGTHTCDLSKPECKKHQRLIHHLLQGIESNAFEIEVLLLPTCCAESKLKERIQKREYLLLEKWSMKCLYSKTQSALEVSQLLRAVRSFLHFSQLSAWLSSSKGAAPSNIYYWVKHSLDGLSTKFEEEPEVHSFPICKISDDCYGSIKVKYPARTQYVPIIPCSKHPPLQGYSIRTLNESSSLHQNLPLNTQIVRQLHKTNFDQQSVLTAKSYVSESPAILLAPVTLLKTISSSEGNKSNRVLKHSNSQVGLINTNNASFDLKQSKNLDVVSKPPTSVCNYSETFNNGLSQENLRFRKKRHLHKKEAKSKKFHRDTLVSASPDLSKLNQCSGKYSGSSNDVSSQMKVNSNESLGATETSPTIDLPFLCQTFLNSCHESERKDSLHTTNIPHKTFNCDKKLTEFSNNSSAHLSEVISPQKIESSHTEDRNYQIPTNKSFEKGECSTHAFISCCIQHEIKNSDTSSSEENNNSLSKCISSSSELPHANSKIADLNSTNAINSKKCSRKRMFEETNCLSNSILSTNPKFRSHDASSDSKEKCKRKKLESRNVCKNVNSHTSLYSVSKQLKLPKQREKISHSKREMFQTENLPSKKTCCKTVIESNKNQLNNYFLSESCSKNNALDTKLLNGCNRIFLETNNTNEVFKLNCEADLNFRKRNSLCTKNITKLLNSSVLSSFDAQREKRRRNKYDKFKNINTVLKRSRDTVMTVIEPVLPKKSKIHGLQVRNKFHIISEKKNKYKGSKKKIFKPLNNAKCASSQSFNEKDANLTSCFVDSCQYQNLQPKTVLSKEISGTFTNTSQSLLPNIACDLDGKSSRDFIRSDSISCGYECNSILQLGEISLPNDSQCSIVLNRVVPPMNGNVPCENSSIISDHFPRLRSKFPKGRKLLANFEESILKGCLPTVNNVKGFHAEIGASGSFFPNHLTLPADVSFYEMGNSHQGAAPYVAHVILGDAEYYLPRKGAVQVTLFNPSETVVKMFILNYDLSQMPPMCHTFIRQKIYYLPVGSTEEYPSSEKWLRFIIHLRFASSKTGKIFLHEDFKIVVLNKTNDDAASEFSQEPRELRSFLSVPKNPTFSDL